MADEEIVRKKKCPNCGSEMEGVVLQRADELIVPEGKTWVSAGFSHVPHSHYRCDECDSEWVWYKGDGGIRSLDAGITPLDFDIKSRK